MSPKEEFGQSPNRIATQSELLARLAARSKPQAVPALVPHGWVTVEVNQQVKTENENEIHRIGSRLSRATDFLRNDRARAVVRGKAKSDFGRCD